MALILLGSNNLLSMCFNLYFLEETRVPCVKAGLMSAILSNLESEDPNVVLQSLRAIGNISFDNGR